MSAGPSRYFSVGNHLQIARRLSERVSVALNNGVCPVRCGSAHCHNAPCFPPGPRSSHGTRITLCFLFCRCIVQEGYLLVESLGSSLFGFFPFLESLMRFSLGEDDKNTSSRFFWFLSECPVLIFLGPYFAISLLCIGFFVYDWTSQ